MLSIKIVSIVMIISPCPLNSYYGNDVVLKRLEYNTPSKSQ